MVQQGLSQERHLLDYSPLSKGQAQSGVILTTQSTPPPNPLSPGPEFRVSCGRAPQPHPTPSPPLLFPVPQLQSCSVPASPDVPRRSCHQAFSRVILSIESACLLPPPLQTIPPPPPLEPSSSRRPFLTPVTSLFPVLQSYVFLPFLHT